MNKFIIEKCEIDLWSSSCMYVFYLNKVPIYCGSSANGLIRPLSRQHKSIARALCAGIIVGCYGRPLTARKVERRFIRKYRPKYNISSGVALRQGQKVSIPPEMQRFIDERRKERLEYRQNRDELNARHPYISSRYSR